MPSKEYYQKNRDKVLAINRQWRKNNWEKHSLYCKEYAKKRYRERHPISELKYAQKGLGWNNIRKKVLERDNFICRNCGRKATEVHHIDGSGSNKPAKEKNNNLDNLIAVCHRCNIHLDLTLHNGCFNNGNIKKMERNKKIMNYLKKYSQSEIARMMGITRQRVHQIIHGKYH